MKWKVQKEDEHYKIIPKCGENNDLILAVGWNLANINGIDIEERNVTNDEGKWKIDLCNGYVRYTEQVKLYYDQSSLDEYGYTAEDIKQLYLEAVEPFMTNFYFKIEVESIQYNAQLNRDASCPLIRESDKHCTSQCGSNCVTDRHTSGERLLNLNLGSGYSYNCRIVGYALCHVKDGEHTDIDGIAKVGGKSSVVTLKSYYDYRTIQHELSHNLNCEHCGNSNCLMVNGTDGSWCSDCRETICETLRDKYNK